MSKQVRLVEIFHPDSEYSDWSPKSIFPSRNPLPLFVVNSKVNWPSIRQRWFVQWVCQSLEHWSQPMPMQCCSFLTIKVWKLVSSNRWKFSHVLFVHPGRLWEVLSSDSPSWTTAPMRKPLNCGICRLWRPSLTLCHQRAFNRRGNWNYIHLLIVKDFGMKFLHIIFKWWEGELLTMNLSWL